MNKLYRDTVTLYHADAAAQTVVRTVLRGVCWQQGRRELPDWPGFVPAAVEGAALVQYVLPMRLRGKPHHVEAGAWWNGSGTGVRSLTR